MAMGNLPVASSFLMWSERFATPPGENLCAARLSEPALAPITPSRRTSAATNPQRPQVSVLHRFIDQLLQRALDALALGRRLLQQHEEHVLLAVDHEIAAGGAIPFQFAERTRRRRFCIARIGTHRKTKP